MDLLSISRCPARTFNRSKYCRKSSKNVWIYISLTAILNIIKTSPTYISFFTSFTKKKSRVQKWICYQSLNVQQEPLTDQILKKINTGCLDLYELNNNLEHNQTSPEYISFFHFIYKKNKVGFKNGEIDNRSIIEPDFVFCK